MKGLSESCSRPRAVSRVDKVGIEESESLLWFANIHLIAGSPKLALELQVASQVLSREERSLSLPRWPSCFCSSRSCGHALAREGLSQAEGVKCLQGYLCVQKGHLAGRKGKSWRKTAGRVFLTLFSTFFFRSLKTADQTWKKESLCSPPCSTTGTFSSCLSTLWSNRRTLLLETGMSFRTRDLAAGGD